MLNATLRVLWMMLIFALPGCTSAKTATGILGDIDYPKEDFRGAWLTSISNLDWPVSNRQSIEDQKSDAIAILDSLKAIGINAILFQVRAESDALYSSSYDPWSYWLTGEQGRAPDPFYDPLSFMIRETHKRGMELHAWMNPFRVERRKGSYSLAGSNVSLREPEWVLEFEMKPDTFYTMLNPGLPEVRDYVTNVVIDIIQRYDVDGIHFDDYFYPYSPVNNEDFLTFQDHHNDIAMIGDWRRNNINRLIAQVYDSIQVLSPHVSFGVSPFAIRKNEDTGTRGLEGYHQLYTDGVFWLESRKIDYINPQLYFEIGNEWADYGPLLTYWAQAAYENERHMYAGLSLYKLMDPTDWTLEQAVDQLKFNMNNGKVHGHIFFRTEHMLANLKGYTDVVRNELFRYPTLTPVMPWKSMLPPPEVRQLAASWSGDGRLILNWSGNNPDSGEERAARYAVYRIDKSSRLFDRILDAVASVSEKRSSYSNLSASDILANSNALLAEILQSRHMLDVTGQNQYDDLWPEGRSEAIYIVTSVSHNSIESKPVIIHTIHDGSSFYYSKL